MKCKTKSTLLSLTSPKKQIFQYINGPVVFKGCINKQDKNDLPTRLFLSIGYRSIPIRRTKQSDGEIEFCHYFSTGGGLKRLQFHVHNEHGSEIIWQGIIYHRPPKDGVYLSSGALPPLPSSHNISPQQCGSVSAKIAVILHLHYLDLWNEFAAHISQLPQAFDLYISTPDRQCTQAREIISQQFPNAKIFPVENRGRDILPFLHIFKQMPRWQYDYICKIHSKKSPQRFDGDRWRRLLLQDLLGSPTIINHTLQRFTADSRLGIITPFDSLATFHKTQGLNQILIDKLICKLGLSNASFAFPKGSMFWARPQVLEPLLTLNLGPSDFPDEAGQLDGTMAHAVERAFGLAALKANFSCAETPDILL